MAGAAPPRIDPWRFVDADDDVVADLLAGTVEAVAELGGWLHPDLRVVSREGQIWITCPADDGVPLLRVPSSAFVRIGRVTWSDSSEVLEIVDAPDDLTDRETELLYLQTALHNVCGKIPWLTQTHPVLAPDLPTDVIDAVRAFRPSFRRSQPTPASLFWSNRAFRLPIGDRIEPVALPIVDLLNHARGGATGSWDGDAFTVTAAHAGTSECVLDYGHERDAIGMAVVYGFADASATCAHSAPLRLAVPGVGIVTVHARGRARTGALLPPVVTTTDEGIEVSMLTFRTDGLLDVGTHLDTTTMRAIARANAALAGRLVDTAGRYPTVRAARILHDAATIHRHLIEAAVR